MKVSKNEPLEITTCFVQIYLNMGFI